jgi:hypothetical protein
MRTRAYCDRSRKRSRPAAHRRPSCCCCASMSTAAPATPRAVCSCEAVSDLRQLLRDRSRDPGRACLLLLARRPVPQPSRRRRRRLLHASPAMSRPLSNADSPAPSCLRAARRRPIVTSALDRSSASISAGAALSPPRPAMRACIRGAAESEQIARSNSAVDRRGLSIEQPLQRAPPRMFDEPLDRLRGVEQFIEPHPSLASNACAASAAATRPRPVSGTRRAMTPAPTYRALPPIRDR